MLSQSMLPLLHLSTAYFMLSIFQALMKSACA